MDAGGRVTATLVLPGTWASMPSAWSSYREVHRVVLLINYRKIRVYRRHSDSFFTKRQIYLSSAFSAVNSVLQVLFRLHANGWLYMPLSNREDAKAHSDILLRHCRKIRVYHGHSSSFFMKRQVYLSSASSAVNSVL